VLFGRFDKRLEVHLQIEDILFDVEFAADIPADRTDLQQLPAVERHRERLAEEVALQRFGLERIDVDAEAAQQFFGHGAQREERCGLRLHVPRSGHGDARHGDGQAVLFGIGCQGGFVRTFGLVVEIAVAELVEFQVAVAAVGVELHGFQHVEQQRLAHDAEVGAQRVEDTHAVFRPVALQPFVIGRPGQRVGHDLRKAVGR